MKIAYFDGPSGASGDMILSALVDAGLPPGDLEKALSSLPIESFRIVTEKRSRAGIGGTGLRVDVEEKVHPRGYPQIVDAIDSSGLPDRVKEKAKGIFRLLGEAEAEVHKVPIEKIHFHEVGAVDSIVDVVGAVTALHMLGVDEVYAAPPATGSGTVRAAHGILPLPAPATLKVLRGRESRPTSVDGELLTPTGAAILVGLTDRFGPPPRFVLDRTGYGIGAAEREEPPNLLRVTLGETTEFGPAAERVVLVETDLDDLTGEAIGYLFEKAFAHGALDLVVIPTLMKKNRPGHRISLLAPVGDGERMARFLAEETGTLGVRLREMERFVLEREIVEIATRFGPIRFKRSSFPGEGAIRLTPEYDDCVAAARERGVPFLRVWEAALRDGEERA